MARGLAAGLAEGIGNGMQLYNQNRYYDSLNEHRRNQDGLRQQQADAKTADKSTKGGDYEGFDNALMPIFNGGNRQPQQRPVMASPSGLAPQAGAIPDAAFSSNPAAAYQAGSLASTAPPKVDANVQPEENISPRQQIVKDMMFGNLANEPDKLNAIAAAAAMNGLGDKITPWVEGLYKAKKTGIFDGAMSLINNNVDGAIDSLKRGGIQLEDRPVKVNPDDPNDHRWKINVSGTGERVMDVKNMVGSTMDADKFLKWQNDTLESQGKRNVSDSAVRENDSMVKVNNARIGKLGEETRGIREERKGGAGALGGIGKLPAPAATAEWLVRNGVHDNYKDAFNAVKTLNDKSPSAARASLIEAAMKNGSAIGEAAKEVDDFLAQSGRPSNPGGGLAPVPSGAIRKYNPRTGGFD